MATGAYGAAEPAPTFGAMNSIHLTDAELEMARHGMTAFLRSFGHDEADTLAVIKSVIAKLAAAQPEPEQPVVIG